MSQIFTKLSRRVVASGVIAAAGAFAVLAAPGTASAAAVPTCAGIVTEGTTSAWCALFDARGRTPEQAQLSLDAAATSLTVTTESTVGARPPASTAVCLTATPAAQIVQQLTSSSCTGQYAGVWLTWSGGSQAIDLTLYPQFATTTFTVQVIATTGDREGRSHGCGGGGGHHGHNQSSYNNFIVQTSSTGTNG
jgi:hypothetical protein